MDPSPVQQHCRNPQDCPNFTETPFAAVSRRNVAKDQLKKKEFFRTRYGIIKRICFSDPEKNPTPEPSEPGTDFGLLVDHLKRFIDYEAVPRDPAQEPHHDEDLRRRQEDEALPVLVEAPMVFSNYFFSNFNVASLWQTSRGPFSAGSTSKICK